MYLSHTGMFPDAGETAFSNETKNMHTWSLVTVERNFVVKSVELPDHQGVLPVSASFQDNADI